MIYDVYLSSVAIVRLSMGIIVDQTILRFIVSRLKFKIQICFGLRSSDLQWIINIYVFELYPFWRILSFVLMLSLLFSANLVIDGVFVSFSALVLNSSQVHSLEYMSS